jgi:protein-disulfide isomerase
MRQLIPLLAAATLASPAVADLTSMSEQERAAFREEVRSYLLENPEVLMEAIGILEERQAEAQMAADEELVADHADALFADGISWVGGNPDGDVTMVEFLDYRCGYCRRAHPEVNELVEMDGEIRYVIKEFPILGEQSVLASRFAISTRNIAGPESYKNVHDALMTLRSDVTDAALERIAAELELDASAIMAGMDAPEVAAEINANRALAQSMGIGGTPTFVVGSQMLRGYLPQDEMIRVVEKERADS